MTHTGLGESRECLAFKKAIGHINKISKDPDPSLIIPVSNDNSVYENIITSLNEKPLLVFRGKIGEALVNSALRRLFRIAK